jgi:multidrug resistance efflux pump
VNERTDNSHGTSLSDRVRSLRLQEKPKRARSGGGWLPWTLCLVLAGSTGYLGYMVYDQSQSAGNAPNPELNQDSPGNRAAVRGTDGTASSGEVALLRRGYIIPAHQILLSPKVSGVIVDMEIKDKDGHYKVDQKGNRIPLMEGIRVEKDDILAQLETVDYLADYNRAVATVNLTWQNFLELYTGNRPQEIRQAKADLEEMEANLKQLQLDYKRSRRLTGSSAMADKDYEQAESLYKAMDRRTEKMRQAYQLMLEGARLERIEAAWAQFEQAEADLDKAKWRLDNCTIRAPVSGTILTKKAEIGNLVNSLAFAGSLNLCEMADLSDLEVELSVEERDIAKVVKDQRCIVRAEAYPERVYEGYVSRLMPSADRAKSSVWVRVKLKVDKSEEGVYLKPEMGADVSFLKMDDKTTAKKK